MKTKVEFVGQKYVDEAVYSMPTLSPVELSLRKAFGRDTPAPVEIGRERVKLRWWKPDGNGGLVRQ